MLRYRLSRIHHVPRAAPKYHRVVSRSAVRLPVRAPRLAAAFRSPPAGRAAEAERCVQSGCDFFLIYKCIAPLVVALAHSAAALI